MKLPQYILIIGFLAISFLAKADPTSYSGEVTITAESKKYIAIHYHNWTSDTEEELYDMISTDQNPFDDNNNYAYLELIDKRTGKTIFKKPSTALTQIVISENEKHIVGISNIMVWNPYQLVIYDINGELTKKRNFSSEEAKLTKNEYDEFASKYYNECEKLVEFTYHHNDHIYIDFLRMGMPTELGDAWDYLMDFIVPNHLTPNIWETTTNYVQWFHEEDPKMELNYDNDWLKSIKINDTKKERFEINISE